MPIIKKNELVEENMLPNISGRMFSSDNNSFSFTNFKNGARSPKHKHPMEEVLIILEGSGEFLIGEDVHEVGKGDVIIVPPMTLHQFTAKTDCSAIEIFQPKLTPEIIAMLKDGS